MFTNNNFVANVRFDYNDRDNIYYFMVNKGIKSWLCDNEIVMVNTRYGYRLGYFTLYTNNPDFTPEKEIVSRATIKYGDVPIELLDEYCNVFGFIMLKVNDKYIKYNFKDHGLVGVINHMISNNISSAFVGSTSRTYSPIEDVAYYKLSVDYNIDDSSDGYTYKFITDDYSIGVKIKEANDEDIVIINSSMSAKDINKFDMHTLPKYDTWIYYQRILETLDDRMTVTADAYQNYYVAIRNVNSWVPEADVTFGYIINPNDDSSASILKFSKTDMIGVYDAYFVMKYTIDPSTFGRGYYAMEDDSIDDSDLDYDDGDEEEEDAVEVDSNEE